MNVAIVGPRDLWINDNEMRYAIEASGFDLTSIVTGDAKGVDTCAIRYAQNNDIPYVSHPAKWAEQGKSAGPIRNWRKIIREADATIAFVRKYTWVSSGTASAIAETVVKNIPYYIVKVG